MNRKSKAFGLLNIFVMILGVSILFGGCAKTNQDGKSAEKKVKLYVYNWGEYIDPEINEKFMNMYPNIDIVYEIYDTMDTMKTKLMSGGTNYDIICPSDFMVAELVRENMLLELDYSNIPNYANVGERFKNQACDPENKYTVPYFWGTVGILYDKTKVTEPVDSWDILWDDKYKGDIIILDSMRDIMGITLKKLGYDMSTTNVNEIEEARDLLVKQKPIVYGYYVDEIKDMMMAGDAAMAVSWSGPAMDAYWEGAENLAYSIPKEGSNIWVDNMCIPKTAKHKKEAEIYINYLMDTEIAYMNTDYVGYSTPNLKVVDMIKDKTPELLEMDAYWPSEEVLSRCEQFRDLGDFKAEYSRVWTEMKAK